MNVKQYENPDWYKLLKFFKAAEKPYKIYDRLNNPLSHGCIRNIGKTIRGK